MNILLLSGESIKNKIWIEEIREAIVSDYKYASIYVASYEHWKTGKQNADVDLEISKVADFVKGSNEPYIIFAKSIGSIITLKAMHENKIHPQAIYFVGVPYLVAKELSLPIDDWISSVNVPTLIEQKFGDPLCSFDILKEVINNPQIKVNQYKRVGEGDDDHSYGDIEYIKSKIVKISNES